MRAVVVGAGIAGSSLALALRDAGHEAVVVSDPGSATDSLSAAAVLRRAWHAGAERDTYDRTLALYAARGVEVVRGGWATSYQRPGAEPRWDKDWALMDPAAPLISADVAGHAVPHGPAGVRVNGTVIDGDRVFWCPGAHARQCAGETWGVTWVHDDPAVLAQIDALTVHMVAPYKTIVAGVVGGHVRLGSSSAATPDKAMAQADKLLALFGHVGLVTSLKGWTARLGRRVQRTGGATIGGLHRTGYAVAPALAEAIVRASAS